MNFPIRTIGWGCPVVIIKNRLDPYAVTDWAAWVEGDEETIGYGDSEDAAKEDLFRQICGGGCGNQSV